MEAAYLVLSADSFAPDADGNRSPVVINITDPEKGSMPWAVPEDTMRQVYSDFAEYLSR